MNTVIIILICLIIGIYFLKKLFFSVYLYQITESEFNEYKKLPYEFSNERLELLHQHLLKCVQRIENVIEFDRNNFKEISEKDTILWQQEIDTDKQILEEFKAMLAEVEREIAARTYFNAQR